MKSLIQAQREFRMFAATWTPVMEQEGVTVRFDSRLVNEHRTFQAGDVQLLVQIIAHQGKFVTFHAAIVGIGGSATFATKSESLDVLLLELQNAALIGKWFVRPCVTIGYDYLDHETALRMMDAAFSEAA
jgi:hypothetical protein